MKIYILKPEKTIYEGEIISLQATGIDGSFQLLDHHDYMIAFLKEGNIQLDQDKFSIKNGMVEVKNGMVKILVDS